MLIQETINEPDTLLKLFVNLDDQLLAVQPQLNAQHLPRDPRGGVPQLRSAEVLTMLIFGAWLALTDKAKLYFYFQRHHLAEFRALPHYSKFVAATNRVVREAGALLGRQLQQNRAAQQGHPLVLQDSTPVPVCKVARAKRHRTFKQHARKSRNGSGYWYGFKLHAQCDQRGRLCAVRLTAANVDDRQLLDPLSDWIKTGIIVADRGYISQERARELGRPGIHLYTPNRKNMKKLATPFQVACLQARHRIEECFEFLKCCFGMIRSTHRAEHAFAIHLLCVYSRIRCITPCFNRHFFPVIALIVLLIVLLIVAGMTPSVEALKNISPNAIQRSKVEQELLRAERAVIDVSVGRDAKALHRLLSEDYLLITEDGEVMDRAKSIAGLDNPALVFENFQTEDVKVRVYGNTAVVTGRYLQKGQQKGAVFSTPYRYTEVYVKRG